MKTSAAVRSVLREDPRPPHVAQAELLEIVVRLQGDVLDLARRVLQNERELAQARAGGAVGETGARRRMPLDEAGRRGLLPRCPRTIRNWIATPESRALWQTDLFVHRVANRVEIDLDGLERWRLAMAAPTTPAWPTRWGKKSPQ